MEQYTIGRSELNPKAQLLNLLSITDDYFIIMMSKEWFDELERCPGVEEHESKNGLTFADYQIFDLYENCRWNSKVLKTIKIINIDNIFVLVSHRPKTATKIYYLE